jgi:hypothetical protein
MSGSLIIPPAVNYQAPIVSIPTLYNNAPKEGRRMVPITIPWNSAGPNNCVYINTSQNTPNPISQIVALAVDNTRCGSDVIFSFPDTQQTITVPTGESVVIPVFTGSLSFYVLSPDALSTDVTNFIIHNSLPPAIDINKSRFVNVVSSVIVATNTTLSEQLIPVGVNGTITDINLSVSAQSTTGGDLIGYFNLHDENSDVSIYAAFGYQGGLCLNVSNTAIRFNDGFKISFVEAGNIPLYVSVFIAYSVP